MSKNERIAEFLRAMIGLLAIVFFISTTVAALWVGETILGAILGLVFGGYCIGAFIWLRWRMI